MRLNYFPSPARHVQDAAVIYKVTRKTAAWSRFVLRQPLTDAASGCRGAALRGHRLLHPRRMWEAS